MKSIIVFYAALAVVCPLEPADYYWRDYYGTIPEDAFKAASEVDIDGVEQNVLYVGQVYVHGVGLLIGGLTPGEPLITTTGGVEKQHEVYNRKRNVKILCTRSPQKFQWFSTNRDHLQSHRDLNFVIGGAQAEQEGFLWIGRVNYLDQGWIIGKVDGYRQSSLDIYFPHNGVEISLPNIQYEVLLYNEPSVPRRAVDLKIFSGQ